MKQKTIYKQKSQKEYRNLIDCVLENENWIIMRNNTLLLIDPEIAPIPQQFTTKDAALCYIARVAGKEGKSITIKFAGTKIPAPYSDARGYSLIQVLPENREAIISIYLRQVGYRDPFDPNAFVPTLAPVAIDREIGFLPLGAKASKELRVLRFIKLYIPVFQRQDKEVLSDNDPDATYLGNHDEDYFWSIRTSEGTCEFHEEKPPCFVGDLFKVGEPMIAELSGKIEITVKYRRPLPGEENCATGAKIIPANEIPKAAAPITVVVADVQARNVGDRRSTGYFASSLQEEPEHSVIAHNKWFWEITLRMT